MNQATTRSIFRWIHIIFAMPIAGYIYSPFDKIPNYAALLGLSSSLYLSLQDFGCGKAIWFEDFFRRERLSKMLQIIPSLRRNLPDYFIE
ncbi:MAG TPA: hypothetical protein VF748_03365 [Candidatus Acidoferrum sp.]